MLFSITGVLLFSLWIFLGTCAPAFLDLKAWGVPQFLRGILIFVSVLLGPIVPLVTVLSGSVKMLINRKREAEKWDFVLSHSTCNSLSKFLETV